jgi:hypothetical protein
MRKINIKPEHCYFYVNKEAGKVTCVLFDTKYLLENFLNDNGTRTPFFYPDFKVELPNKFVGIASCSPEDEWNEELGKRIAFMRMKRKFYTAFFNAATKFFNDVDKYTEALIDCINRYGEKISENLRKDNEYINSQLDKNDKEH